MSDRFEYFEITDPNSNDIIRFHDDVLVEAFPDYYCREDPSILRDNVSEGSWIHGNEICKYHLVICKLGEEVVAGVSFYFFSFGDYALGMGSYLGVRKKYRGKGLGIKLINVRDRILITDSNRYCSKIKGLIIQVNDPSLMRIEEIRQDSMNPWKREIFWRRRGYRKIAFNFVQPSIRAGDPPVEYLSLYLFPYTYEWEKLEQLSRKDMEEIVYCFVKCTGTVGPMELDPSYQLMKSELAQQEYFDVIG